MREFNPDPNFVAWGPFIPAWYKNQAVTVVDITIASVVFGLTILAAFLALYLAYGQSKASRSPLRSTYVWLIWLELLASFLMGIECYLHLLKLIRPSFAFYFTILFWWCIQVQLLLQIIINRIRVIVPDRRRSKHIMIGTAVIVTAINISVFNIWIPARLQTNHTYIRVNEIWDRIEKVVYLIIDAALNWYFLKTVKENLINNGLQKYNKLLIFNQRIIVVSLLMDVMIIAAMSIPNSFVYIQFHPLAYIIKLNIEMVMANLIKRIAVSKSRRMGNASIIEEFASSSNKSSSANTGPGTHVRRSSYIELSAKMFSGKHKDSTSNSKGGGGGRAISFAPTGTQIKKTEEITVRSEPNPEFLKGDEDAVGLAVSEREIANKSLDDVTESAESMKSVERQRREDSDDEAVLVSGKSKYGWGRSRD
ncbi:hypothetical protein K505DRAFT_409675 [Melanomma pulvis-pyrius CBS 109.77]|uniref:Integral membrane protein n=1 Tax=Melanomma pulvis-pyrius CBS 109.77 TaxID=1314802 RepID=A0A6A6X3J0_9PLEO|nr:hypothetical protein K505DRAFT_409675 [Melanomma pulvis-pyrius CBS 109.77]